MFDIEELIGKEREDAAYSKGYAAGRADAERMAALARAQDEDGPDLQSTGARSESAGPIRREDSV